MQIPIYVATKVNEVGSPVPINSAENTAGGMMGEAVKDAGKALFGLTLALKKERTEQEKERERLEAQIAVGEARQMMIQERAAQRAAKIEDNDNADGTSAMQRFSGRVDERINGIADTLSSDRARNLFRAAVGDDKARESQLVLANELEKTEKVIPVMQAQYVSSLGSEARLDDETPGRTMMLNMSKVELFVQDAKNISDADKPLRVRAYQQEIAKSAISGYLDRGNQDPAQFDRARELLIGKTAESETVRKLFSEAEIEKELAKIDLAQNRFYDLTWKKTQREETIRQRDFERKQDAAMASYNNQLQLAGNDQEKYDAIQRDILRNPNLSPEKKQALALNTKFMERGDDEFEKKFWNSAVGKKSTLGLKKDINQAVDGGKLSVDRSIKLLKALDGMDESIKQDPNIRSAISAAEAEIKNAGTFTKVTALGMPVTEVKQEALTAVTQFNLDVGRIMSKRAITAGDVEALTQKYLKGMGKVRSSETSQLPGVSPNAMFDAEANKRELLELDKKINKEWKTAPNEKKEMWIQQRNGLIDAQTKIRAQKEMKIIPSAPSTKGVYDE